MSYQTSYNNYGSKPNNHQEISFISLYVLINIFAYFCFDEEMFSYLMIFNILIGIILIWNYPALSRDSESKTSRSIMLIRRSILEIIGSSFSIIGGGLHRISKSMSRIAKKTSLPDEEILKPIKPPKFQQNDLKPEERIEKNVKTTKQATISEAEVKKLDEIESGIEISIITEKGKEGNLKPLNSRKAMREKILRESADFYAKIPQELTAATNTEAKTDPKDVAKPTENKPAQIPVKKPEQAVENKDPNKQPAAPQLNISLNNKPAQAETGLKLTKENENKPGGLFGSTVPSGQANPPGPATGKSIGLFASVGLGSKPQTDQKDTAGTSQPQAQNLASTQVNPSNPSVLSNTVNPQKPSFTDVKPDPKPNITGSKFKYEDYFINGWKIVDDINKTLKDEIAKFNQRNRNMDDDDRPTEKNFTAICTEFEQSFRTLNIFTNKAEKLCSTASRIIENLNILSQKDKILYKLLILQISNQLQKGIINNVKGKKYKLSVVYYATLIKLITNFHPGFAEFFLFSITKQFPILAGITIPSKKPSNMSLSEYRKQMGYLADDEEFEAYDQRCHSFSLVFYAICLAKLPEVVAELPGEEMNEYSKVVTSLTQGFLVHSNSESRVAVGPALVAMANKQPITDFSWIFWESLKSVCKQDPSMCTGNVLLSALQNLCYLRGKQTEHMKKLGKVITTKVIPSLMKNAENFSSEEKSDTLNAKKTLLKDWDKVTIGDLSKFKTPFTENSEKVVSDDEDD